MTKCLIDDGEARFLLTKDGYGHYRCSQCGLVFVWPQPSDDKLKTEVYSEESGYQAGKATDDGSAGHSRHIWKILRYLKTEVRPPTRRTHLRNEESSALRVQTPKLLDVGCSNGDFLFAVRDLGFEVAGVELNPRTARQAQNRGLDVAVGTLIDAKYESARFDFVHLGDVIEHVPDPRALIIECKRILKSNGQIIISTPNISSFWAQATLGLYNWFNIPWSIATPPHHLFLFNSHNLDLLLTQAGFGKISKWFENPPKLMYELGNTRLFGRWRHHKSFKNLRFLIFGFGLYSLIYFLNWLMSPLMRQNFGQIGTYQPKADKQNYA